MSAELTLIISGRAVLISLVPGRSRKRNTPFFLFSRIQQPSYRVTDERRINAHYALGRDKAIKQSSPRILLQPHGLHHCEQDFARQELPSLPVLREKEVNVERHSASPSVGD